MSVKSWHDSDDVDSEVECEAYNMLYYELSKKKEATINTSIFENLTTVVQPDSVIELTTEDEDCVVISSDSDDSFVPEKIACSNKVSDLYVGLGSSDSECEEITKNMQNSADSSFILNINVNFKPKVPDNIPKNNGFKVADWSLDMNYTQPRSIGLSRYFDETRSSVCELCLKKGHSQSACDKKGPVCILCGKEGHISNNCDDIICHVCFQTDHLAKKCPFISTFLKNGCRRCGQRGHSEQICPDIWRQYKYTLSGALPLKNTCSSQNKHDVYCANCSRQGHFTDQCHRNRMASRFIGPAPIMEIVQFDLSDIYNDYGLSYVNKPLRKAANLFTDATDNVDSMIMDMDVTGIIHDMDLRSEYSSSDNDHCEPNNRCLGFGDGTIMLSPIVKNLNTKQSRAPVLCSTPALKRNPTEPLTLVNVAPNNTSQLPRVPLLLLKKLFPTETQEIETMSTGVRTKLRRSLENMLRNGYVKNGCTMTQDQKNDWLKEISICQKLNNNDRRKLMDSVSSAQNHSTQVVIANTVIHGNRVVTKNVTIDENAPREHTEENIENSESEKDLAVVTDVPASRRKRNKAMRQQKSLQNELKFLKKDITSQKKVIEIDLTNESTEYVQRTKRHAAPRRRGKSAKKSKNDQTVMVCD